MKNLQVIKRKNAQLRLDSSTIVAFCIDADNGVIFLLDSLVQLTRVPIDHIEDEMLQPRKIELDLDISSLHSHDIKTFEFVVEEQAVLMVLRKGGMFLLSCNGESDRRVYNHSEEIASVSISPAQDLIALADEKNNLMIMSFLHEQNWAGTVDPVSYSTNALTENNSLNKPVGVGWGSKETQFFGLDGRPSQEKRQKETEIVLSDEEIEVIKKIEESKEFNKFHAIQHASTILDWRGDGQHLATLTYIPDSAKHYLKVWNRRLELQYMSEQLVDICRGLLSYVPDGHLICCTQRRNNTINEITLFEKNGLTRQRVTLPTVMKNTYISSISWSPDSKILAILVKQFCLSDEKVSVKNILLLYTMQNWHCYLKFSTELEDMQDYSIRWNQINANRLQLMSLNGNFSEYDCNFYINFSDDNLTVAVVDANRILITPLEKCIIPPPHSLILLETNSPISCMNINHSNATELAIITLNHQLICTSDKYNLNNDPSAPKVAMNQHLSNQQIEDILQSYKRIRTFQLDHSQHFQHLTKLDEFNLLASTAEPNSGKIVMINTKSTNAEVKTLKTFWNRQVIGVSRYQKSNSKAISIALDDMTFHILDAETASLKQLDLFLTGIEKLNDYSIIDMHAIEDAGKTGIITLGHDLCLRFNEDVLVTNSCTSFRLTENYLSYTTTENTLHFVMLKHLWNKGSSAEYWSQTIENGGTLVTVSEINSRVILQMPRGNLETLNSRVLVFATLTRLMEKGKYIEACKLARRHRVNMNFLVDYLLRFNDVLDSSSLTPSIGVSKFALDILQYQEGESLLCLVLTELDNCDTISGRYSAILKHVPIREVPSQFDELKTKTKVNTVCKEIASSMMFFPDEDNKFLHARLQLLMKREPRHTTTALELVSKLSDQLKKDSIKFMLYFIDIDQLFKDALCTYDIDIALMVASYSNKDPKQYLTLLDQFNEIDNFNLRQFKINIHVKQYESAFESLLTYRNENVSEDRKELDAQLVDLVVSKRIYKRALSALYFKINPENDNLLELIWSKFGEYLLEKRHYDEAALAFSKALTYAPNESYFKSALKCFSLTDCWQKSVAMIARCDIKSVLKEIQLKNIAEQLSGQGKDVDAIIVLDPKRESISQSILDNLVSKENWYLAEFFASGASRESLRENIVKQLETSYFISVSHLECEMERCKNQWARLKELMTTCQTRKARQDKCFISDSLSTVDGSELSSILVESEQGKTVRSGATSIKTRSSSKSSKPQQKKIQLKQGSRYEDLALIIELRKFMSEQKSAHKEASQLLGALFEYNPYNQAIGCMNRLRAILQEMLNFSHSVSEMLWPVSPLNDQTYSLYKRVNNILQLEVYENVDFEILIRPELPKTLTCFEL